MSEASEKDRSMRLVMVVLPRLVAVVGLVVYLATLNHWVTLPSLRLAAELSGGLPQPALLQPVFMVVTLPFRLLPANWVPVALNLFSAVCASLSLALLTRCVGLLLLDRLRTASAALPDAASLLSVRGAWVPVVLAAGLLGFQLSFWENATAGSSDQFDLLLCASLVWCLLEYRRNENGRWLDGAAAAFGLAVANSWAMIGLLPIFLIAVFQHSRLRFFNRRFLEGTSSSNWRVLGPALAADLRIFLRLGLFLLAGFSLLLVPPAVTAFSPNSSMGFGTALHLVATTYKTYLAFGAKICWYRREWSLVLAAVSLLPLVALTVRWRKSIEGDSAGRLGPAELAFYAAHALLLLVCVAVAFDPPFSPRHVVQQVGMPAPLLSLYFFGALCAGYYSGFLLLLFAGGPGTQQRRLRRKLRSAAQALVYPLAVLSGLGLLCKNFPLVWSGNGPQVDRYARLLASTLPATNAVVVSADDLRLALAQAAVNRAGKSRQVAVVDLRLLPQAFYRAWLRNRYPDVWPEVVPRQAPTPDNTPAPSGDPLADAVVMAQVLAEVAESRTIYALDVRLGRALEQFDLLPHGLLYQLIPCPDNVLSAPALTAAEVAENQAFWTRAIATGAEPLARSVEPPRGAGSARGAGLLRRMGLAASPPESTRRLAGLYSGPLNGWGVALQKTGRWQEAGRCFTLAKRLSPESLPAEINLLCNSNLLAGQKMTLADLSAGSQLSKDLKWDMILGQYGPIDEPKYCYELGLAYARGTLLRQASRYFQRVRELVPDDFRLRLVLAEALTRGGLPARALEVLAEMATDPNLPPLDESMQEARAMLHAKASALGIRLAEERLQQAPESVPALLEKGALCVRSGQFLKAIPPLTRLLSITNDYQARLHRGNAFLGGGNFEAAAADFNELLRVYTNSCQPYLGLGDIAIQAGDTNEAVRCYQKYLASGQAKAAESNAVARILGQLR